MIRSVLVLFVILATVCATEEIATITRRGSVATVEEETSLGRRHLLDWGWLLFHRKYNGDSPEVTMADRSIELSVRCSHNLIAPPCSWNPSS